MDNTLVQKTEEWAALNTIWKSCSKEQRTQLEQDFRLLTTFIRQHTTSRFLNPLPEGYGYLADLSSDAKWLVVNLVNEGEPNLYHSIMAVIESRSQYPKDAVLSYYFDRFADRRVYIKSNWSLICEIFDLCWTRWHKKNS